jgi:hypothetical protein
MSKLQAVFQLIIGEKTGKFAALSILAACGAGRFLARIILLVPCRSRRNPCGAKAKQGCHKVAKRHCLMKSAVKRSNRVPICGHTPNPWRRCLRSSRAALDLQSVMSFPRSVNNPGQGGSKPDHRANALTLAHKIEGLIDPLQWQRVRDHRVDFYLAVEIFVDVTR